MNKAEAQLNSFEAAETPAALTEEQTQSSRVVKPRAERSTSREESGDKGKIHEAVVSGS